MRSAVQKKFRKGFLIITHTENANKSRSRVCAAPFQLGGRLDLTTFSLYIFDIGVASANRFFVCLSKQGGMDWMAIQSGVLGFEGEALFACVRGINLLGFVAHSRSSRLSRLGHSGQKKHQHMVCRFLRFAPQKFVIRRLFFFAFSLPSRDSSSFFRLLVKWFSDIGSRWLPRCGDGWHAQKMDGEWDGI